MKKLTIFFLTFFISSAISAKNIDLSNVDSLDLENFIKDEIRVVEIEKLLIFDREILASEAEEEYRDDMNQSILERADKICQRSLNERAFYFETKRVNGNDKLWEVTSVDENPENGGLVSRNAKRLTENMYVEECTLKTVFGKTFCSDEFRGHVTLGMTRVFTKLYCVK